MRTWYHDPVLLQEVLEQIPAQAHLVMDGTLGHGGHSQKILEIAASQAPRNDITVIGVDRDAAMMAKAQERLQAFGAQMGYVRGSYADFSKIMEVTWGQKFDCMLLDIGVNMEHFKDGERGFSIKKDGPLDMRFDTSVWMAAQERLSTCTTNQFHAMLTNFTDFSEKRIVKTSEEFFKTNRDFSTTFTLSTRAKTIGMSDKVMAIFFQAIRIVVNGELDEFQSFLDQFTNYLTPAGRCIVLTYHSIEDRMAKIAFKALEDEGKVSILTKHVIQPSRQEKQRNPAARSAKMRVVSKNTFPWEGKKI
jgi:16S rRNA (cytosine1402-N4)-methyltransferase